MMIDSFRFASAWFLIALPLIPFVVGWGGWNPARSSVLFSSLKGFQQPPKSSWHYVRKLLPWIEVAALMSLVVGMSRPQLGRSETRISGQGIAIELILDISGSMEAIDFEVDGADVNRLQAVKHVVREFVQGSSKSGLKGRPHDQIGLVAFGGFADSRCPLTLDHDALIDIVDGLVLPRPIRDSRGRVINEERLQEELATAIGDGLALGLDRLKASKATSKIAVLLTDGESNAGVVDPRDAAKIAKELGIKVYTIGIGRNGVVPIPRQDAFGASILVPGRFSIDEELLKEIATQSGGSYFHASDTSGLVDVYKQIDELEKSDVEETKYAQYTELYTWFVWPGILGVGLSQLLQRTRLRWLT